MIAILLKTTSGRPSLGWAVESIKYALSDYNSCIYLYDEEPVSKDRRKIHNDILSSGGFVTVGKKSTPVGLARNTLLRNLSSENYILRMDDDFELGGEFNINAMITILENSNYSFCASSERQIGHGKGVRSGALRPSGGLFKKTRNNNLIKYFYSYFTSFELIKGIRFVAAEHTRNLILIKREVFDCVQWDEDLIFEGEHSDFLLDLKKNHIMGGFTLDSVHYHRDDLAQFRSDGASLKYTVTDLMEVHYRKKWKSLPVKSKYHKSWYLVEFLRRLICK
jgi:glycosyltransferase involved in cell wall biosynthesis